MDIALMKLGNDPMLKEAEALLDIIAHTNSMKECVETEIKIRRLVQALQKEQKTGRLPNGKPPPKTRRYEATYELLARASAAAVVYVSVEHDKGKEKTDVQALMKKTKVFGGAKK